nr:MAG TPA: hypothetical protein [Caudoviricetes sp.]
MWKTYGSNTRHTTHTTRTIRCNHAKTPQHSHSLRRGRVCVIYTNIVVTQRGVCLRRPVASKQPTCVESEQGVNKVKGRLTETVRDRRHDANTTRPPITRRLSITQTEAPRGALSTSGGLGRAGRAAQSVSSASTRSISRRSATLIRLAVPSSSKIPMSFVTSVTMSRASRRAS